MIRRLGFIASFFVFGLTLADANVPVNDAQVLDQKAQTASTTATIVPLIKNTEKSTMGIKCATTTGKQGSVSDPKIAPSQAVGDANVTGSAPGSQRSNLTGPQPAQAA